MEFDRIAEENEGSARIQRLIQMRKEALRAMNILKAYNPILIGSIWRGTIHHESDIDVRAYHDELNDILKALEKNHCRIARTELITVTEKGQKRESFHAYLELLT
jgi:predicted nucleotidyltransferase